MSRRCHDLGVWSHCYRSCPTLSSPSVPRRKAVQAVQRSLLRYAWHRIVSLVVAHAATSTRGRRRRRRLLALLSLAKVLPEPLHAAVRVTDFAHRLYAHLHSGTAYAYAYAHTTHKQRCCGSTCRFPPDSTSPARAPLHTLHATRRPRRPLTRKVSRLFMGGAENLERDPSWPARFSCRPHARLPVPCTSTLLCFSARHRRNGL